MLIIGCDYHPCFQQIAFVDTETGECGERRLTHREEAEQFYYALKAQVGKCKPPTRAKWRSSGEMHAGV
jgi:transposase